MICLPFFATPIAQPGDAPPDQGAKIASTRAALSSAAHAGTVASAMPASSAAIFEEVVTDM